MRVLIAEDEPRLAEALARGLRRAGWAVDVALDGRAALSRTRLVELTPSCSTVTCPRSTATRSAAGSSPPVLERAGVRLDPARREVAREGRAVALSPKEFGVLDVLMRADGAVVSPEELLERVWDEHVDPFTNTVRVTVMNLRRKLGAPPLIETVIGTGYRMPA